LRLRGIREDEVGAGHADHNTLRQEQRVSNIGVDLYIVDRDPMAFHGVK
jgi:hypothetical protein